MVASISGSLAHLSKASDLTDRKSKDDGPSNKTLLPAGERGGCDAQEAIRSVLPTFIMRLQDDLRGKRALNRTKINLFVASNLRPIELSDLQSLYVMKFTQICVY
jgi:hypothetical protein